MSRIFSPRNLLIILLIIAVIVLSRLFFPVPLPTIVLAPEQVGHLNILGFPITNTLLALLIADATVLILGWLAVRRLSLVPGMWQNTVEAIFEFFFNLAQDLVGADTARRIIPVAMSVFALILACNWWGRVPGFEAFGLIEKPHEAGLQTWQVQQLLPGLYNITANPGPAATKADVEKAKAGGEEEHGVPEYGILVPTLRATTTDLNFPLALAICAFLYIQYNGFKANGLGYLKKFFNFSGFIPVFVGLLEFISEFAKIISFSFRLFGNIFAGTVLVFVMSFLLPWLVPLPFAGLEIFMGLIQAMVFAGLIIIFSAGAMESHEHHPEIPVADTDAVAAAQEAEAAIRHHGERAHA